MYTKTVCVLEARWTSQEREDTWSRNLEKEIRDNGMNWRQMEAGAQDRQGWRLLVWARAPRE